MRAGLQKAGAFLAGMVAPNIGAFLAWGLITALFIPSGWFPNERLAKLVSPMILNLLPILIGFTGGRLVYGIRGGVVGATATMGVVAGSDIPMFLGAMAIGPLGGLLIQRFDRLVARKIPVGFEMLVNNFSAGIIGMALTVAGYRAFGPLAGALTSALGAGAKAIAKAGLLPLLSLLIEPGKVLFVNNAINHGVLAPLGIAEARHTGKSIFFLLEPNPGPGLGLLAAYWFFGKGPAKASSPGAILIHFFGGIHEMYFPYVLMHPLTLLATVSGGVCGAAVFAMTHAGLVATPSPGSIFALCALAPKGGLTAVLAGVAAGAIASFLVAAPIVSGAERQQGVEPAPQRQAPGISTTVPLRARPASILFVCEAGMGSSVLGQAVLKRKLDAAGLEVEVAHSALSELTAAAEVVIAHRSLVARVKEIAPLAEVYAVDEFIHTPVYSQVVELLAHQGQAAAKAQAAGPLSRE